MFFRYMILISTMFAFLIADVHSYKVLHVMSYHSSWIWNQEQLRGFQEGLGETNVEYKIVELDTKRISDQKLVSQKVDEAKDIIAKWKPDLLYTNDDNAQKYLAKLYTNTSLPIVFSAVNRDPSEYDFLGAKNVTGVMEYEHFIPTVKLLSSIKKGIHKIAVIVDSDPTWKGVMSRIRANLKYLQGIEVVEWILVKSYEEYQSTIKELENKVDAIALLGIFNISDKNGANVDYEELLQWTSKNSNIPDFSFWESRIDRGTLCGVAVSGYQQGLLAGQKAKKILVEGVVPSSIKITSSEKGQPMINLKRAKALGLNIDVEVLLNSTVKKDYIWDR